MDLSRAASILQPPMPPIIQNWTGVCKSNQIYVHVQTFKLPFQTVAKSTNYDLNRSSEEWQRVINDIGQDEDEEHDEDENLSDGSSEAE